MNIAPHPVFSLFGRGDDAMAVLIEMRPCVFVGRRITAKGSTTILAYSQVNPLVTCFAAFFAIVLAGFYAVDFDEVFTVCHVIEC